MSRPISFVALSLFAGLCSSAGWVSAAAPNTTPVTPTAGGVLLEESLATQHAAGWKIAKGDWKFVDGAWQGAELKADKHGAVARHNVAFTDAVIEFDFKLDGAKSISLSINDPKGHNSRLAISPVGIRLTKDDHDHAGPDKAAVVATLQTKLEAGRWYHVRMTQTGEEFSAQVGEHTLSGKHPDIAVAKSNIGFTVAGETASFKNLKITAPAAAK